MINARFILLAHIGWFLFTLVAQGKEVSVSNSTELRAALAGAKPGTTIKLNPGKYQGGIPLKNINGTQVAPVTICGADEKNLPQFSGGTVALHLSDCSYLVLKHLFVSGYPGNGINIDDGGSFHTPTHHITLDHITVKNTGPKGNHDALKLSGLDHFTITHCQFVGWGGSAIDMVGCHHGVIEQCALEGADGFTQSSGIQIKGGSSDIVVQRCFFKDAGQRAINLGGSTGLKYFRPRVGSYEAKNVTIAGNRFVGSMSPIAWVTAHGGHVHHNTFVFPHKWVLRILQETKDPQFKPCHDGLFENNLIIFDQRVRIFVNVGEGTKPGSFQFRSNVWYQVGGKRKPNFPTPEKEGIYQPHLKFEAIETKQMKIHSNHPQVKKAGADAYRE